MEAFATSTDIGLQSQVGQRFDLSDGREVVLVQNAGTALVSGNLIQGPADIAAHVTAMATTAFSAATTSAKATVTVTLGATLVTANQYAGGYMIVAAGTGLGQTMKIASHPAAALSTACVFTLEDNPAVALVAASSTVSIFANPYGSLNGTDYRTEGVVVCPTTLTGRVIGVTFYPIPASTATVASYGLIQTRGLVACINDAGTAIGLDLMPSSNTAGSVMTYVVATKTRVGTASAAGTTTAGSLISVQL